MQPITKRYQNGDKFPAEDMNQLIEAINAGLTPEVVLSKENVKAIVTNFVYDILLTVYSRIGGSSEEPLPLLSLENDVLEISNVLNEDLSAAIREKLQFKLKIDEDFDGLTLNELCDMVNEVMSIMGLNIDMEVGEGVTIRDFIEKAYDNFVPQLLTVIRNLLGTSLNQAFIMTEPLDTNIDAFIKNVVPGIFDFVADIFAMDPEAQEEEIPNLDFGLTIPTQIFLDKITTKYNCEKSDIRIFIFSIASAALIIQIIAPIVKVVVEQIGGGTSPSGVGQIVNLILGYVSSFLGALCTFVINDQHVLLNADLVWPYKKFDYYLSLTVGEEETSGETSSEETFSGETLSEETSGETLSEETSGETVIKPVRLDSGVRLWGDDENNRIGIVRINPKLVEDYTEYLGNYVDLGAELGGLELCIVPFAGKLTIRSISTEGSVVENLSAFIDLDEKYYGKYNMQVNRLRINETTEGFQVAFMRNNTTLFSIDSEMR